MARSLDPALVMSVARAAAGAVTWAHPRFAYRTFHVARDAEYSAGAGIIGRLFGVRDVALAAAVRHPDPAVRRAALQAGLVVDTADVAASVIGVRRGAPAGSLLGVAAGAATFVGLGALALTRA
ncbi:hypothetical protein GCM10027047_35260 [Rhodococcus aerolatus]